MLDLLISAAILPFLAADSYEIREKASSLLSCTNELARPVILTASLTASDLEIRDRCRKELSRRDTLWQQRTLATYHQSLRVYDAFLWEWRLYHLP